MESGGISEGDGDSMRSSSLIGITTAICGNVIISIALNLQRYAHLKLKREAAETSEGADEDDDELGYDADDEAPSSGRALVQDLERAADAVTYVSKSSNDASLEERSKYQRARHTTLPRASTAGSEMSDRQERLPKYMKSGYWWLGIALMAIGETGNFLAYGFAPASTVSPLGVVALVSNCVVAPIFFHENFRVRDMAGVLVAIAGAVTVVFASNPEEEVLDPAAILVAVSQLSFKIYLFVTVAAMGALSVLSNKYGDRWIFVNIALVALYGGYTALSTKAVSSLLSYSFIRVFTFPITYALVLVLVLTAVMQVKYLSRALQHFDSTQVIPTHFVFFTLSVILGSAILYQDFDGATSDRLSRFVFGCVLTFVGVWLITSNRKSADDVKHEDESEFFSTVASVNLDRSAGARTPTSFYDEDEDAQEIRDVAATQPLLHQPIPADPRPLLALNRYGSSPGTSSRTYLTGTAGMGLIVDSVVRDRMKTWQNKQNRRRRRRAQVAEPTEIDSRSAPLYRATTRPD